MTTYEVKPICDVVIFNSDRIAMVDYRHGPDAQQGWYLPNGLFKALEQPEEAAQRILQEHFDSDMTALTLEFVECFSGNDGTWHMVFHFSCEMVLEDLNLSENIEKLEWFSTQDLPERSKVAHHGWFVGTAKRIIASRSQSKP